MRFSLLAACLLVTPAVSEEAGEPARSPPVSEGGTYSFTFENDTFAGDDDDYTNGVRVDYVTPRNDLPAWARLARRNLGWLTGAEDWYATYALGQNMYTPTDISLDDPPDDDRPYAGFFYGSIGIVADRGDMLDTIALDIGVVGPAAQADHVQSIVHELIGARDPKGWDHQLENEPAFRLLYERKYRYGSRLDLGLLDLEADIAPHLSVALGNLDTSAGAGMTFRLGDRLADNYGPPRVRPAVAGPGFFRATGGLGWYVFAGAEARLVGRNIFVEGNTFEEGPGVDPERLVADLQAGVALQYGDVELTYTHVFRTPEFQGQEGFSEFGSLNLRVKF